MPPSSLERHLEDTSTVITSHTHESHYTDGLGNKLSPRENDTLGKAMQLARARLRSDFESFWEYAEYHDVVEEVAECIKCIMHLAVFGTFHVGREGHDAKASSA